MTVDHKRRVRELVAYLRSLDGQPGYDPESSFVAECGWETGVHERDRAITLLKGHLLRCVVCRDTT